MDNTLHLVFGTSGEWRLTSFLKKFKEHEKILPFPCSFTYGYLFKDFSKTELHHYLVNLDNRYGIDYNTPLYGFMDYDFDKHDKIVIWHGNTVDERLFLYMVSALIKKELYEADMADIEDNFQNHTHKPFSFPVAACSIKNLNNLYAKIKPITSQAKQEYISLWDKWSKSEAPLRILDDKSNIIEVREDYFDELLLSKCTSEYTKAALPIALTLIASNFNVGDQFLLSRLIHLLQQNKLSAIQSDQFIDKTIASNTWPGNDILIDGINVTHPALFLVRLNQHDQ